MNPRANSSVFERRPAPDLADAGSPTYDRPLTISCPHCGEENSEQARFCSACGSSLSGAHTESRKVVTILFSDVTGSTSLGEQLDPESLRGVMNRFFDVGRTVVARHGGTVEKFIGDALMAVFGVPHVHEDDALRAVRAALDLVTELEAVNDEIEASYGVRLTLRTGLNTGEVAVGAGEVFATGDAVNVAARLEQLAAPGEILISESTRRLVRSAVEVEPLQAVELKGKSQPVEIWRLGALVGTVSFERQLDTLLVGRERELELLRDTYGRAIAGRSCELFTVLGPAGIGKSRLVGGLVESATETLSLRGQCLPYGSGITYWPLTSVVREAAGLDTGIGVDEAFARIRALLGDDPDADLVTDRLAAATGLGSSGAPAEEIFWAVRRLIETLARERPLILAFDDIHWAEPTFLDLVLHLADRIRDAPVLLVCMARPELLESRPDWAQGRANASSVALEPLSMKQTAQLIGALRGGEELNPELCERIAASAEGNPLFVEEMLAIVGDDGPGEVGVPPTIQALLAARLDQLGAPEREVVGGASVVGQEFSRQAVAALADEPPSAELFPTLVRKQFLRVYEETRFQFWHLLIRDAAYDSLPKKVRAVLHERYARYLEREAGERVGEVEEIVGYHLEQGYRNHVDIGIADERMRALAAEAAGHLIASGARASARGDVRAAAGLLERALGLMPAGTPRRAEAQTLLGATLMEAGRLPEAERQLAEAEAVARQSGDRVAEISATVTRIVVQLSLDPRGFDLDAAAASVQKLIPELEERGADAALAAAWRVLIMVSMYRADSRAAEDAANRAFEYARRAGHVRGEGEALFFSVLCLLMSPTPVAEGLRRCDEALAAGAGPMAEAAARIIAATLLSLQGEIEEARRLVALGQAGFRELGFVFNAEAMAQCDAQIELHAGDPAAADEVLVRSTEFLVAAGDTGNLPMQQALRSVILARLGRAGEALELSRQGEAAASLLGQAYWRCGRALALAAQGRHGEAIELARTGAGMMTGSGDLHGRGEMLESLADVLLAAGDTEGARSALEQAHTLFTEKGCTVCAGRTRDRLAG